MFADISTERLIHTGRELAARIAQDKRNLDAIEAELKSRALSVPHEPLVDAHREGRRATLKDGSESLTVLFESDVLKVSFDANSTVAHAIMPQLGHDQVKALFRAKTTYERIQKDGQKFRLAAFEKLGPDLAPIIIDHLKDRDKNGITKSKISVEW